MSDYLPEQANEENVFMIFLYFLFFLSLYSNLLVGVIFVSRIDYEL